MARDVRDVLVPGERPEAGPAPLLVAVVPVDRGVGPQPLQLVVRHAAAGVLVLLGEIDLHLSYLRALGVKRTRNSFTPLTKLDRSRRGSLTGAMSGSRSRRMSSSTAISSRARWVPRQKCGPPPPKPMCGLGSRPMSKV